jgi:hypothetical protein
VLLLLLTILALDKMGLEARITRLKLEPGVIAKTAYRPTNCPDRVA